MRAFIPYGAYWSSPFCRWQGALAHLHAFDLAAATASRALRRRGIDLADIESGVLGTTVPQRGAFYGMPWLAGELGAPHLTGPTIAQACATGARVLATAAAEIADGAKAVLTITADRVSNGPHIYYPAPQAPGGTGAHEDWVLDNFSRDPYAQVAMIETAENVARAVGIGTAEQHVLVLHRYAQYAAARASGFHARFMDLPFEVPGGRRGQPAVVLDGDEGVQPADAARIARLRPLVEGGTVTHAGQTHPADGTAGMIVADRDRAHALSADPAITIELVAFGQARERKAMMPAAPIPAAQQALDRAGIRIGDVAAIKSHNPFIVNDIAFARHFGIAAESMNNNGCSLVWGHPQGPTGMRAVIELIEELAQRGGGYGLFHGCAAGDSAMAVVLRVGGQA